MAIEDKRGCGYRKESEATPEEIENLRRRGITAVPVPDNDPDHT